MALSLVDEIDALYQRWLEQFPLVQRAYVEGGGQMNMTVAESSWFAIQYNALNREMVMRLAGEIDALRDAIGHESGD